MTPEGFKKRLSVGLIVRHVKSQGRYRVLMFGHWEPDESQVVIYQAMDAPFTGRVWVRDMAEFCDGRFKVL